MSVLESFYRNLDREDNKNKEFLQQIGNAYKINEGVISDNRNTANAYDERYLRQDEANQQRALQRAFANLDATGKQTNTALSALADTRDYDVKKTQMRLATNDQYEDVASSDYYHQMTRQGKAPTEADIIKMAKQKGLDLISGTELNKLSGQNAFNPNRHYIRRGTLGEIGATQRTKLTTDATNAATNLGWGQLNWDKKQKLNQYMTIQRDGKLINVPKSAVYGLNDTPENERTQEQKELAELIHNGSAFGDTGSFTEQYVTTNNWLQNLANNKEQPLYRKLQAVKFRENNPKWDDYDVKNQTQVLSKALGTGLVESPEVANLLLSGKAKTYIQDLVDKQSAINKSNTFFDNWVLDPLQNIGSTLTGGYISPANADLKKYGGIWHHENKNAAIADLKNELAGLNISPTTDGGWTVKSNMDNTLSLNNKDQYGYYREPKQVAYKNKYIPNAYGVANNNGLLSYAASNYYNPTKLYDPGPMPNGNGSSSNGRRSERTDFAWNY